ncbi:hypothetical protein [Streptomyces sp. NPDC018947]|uniref:hypothetical protein n=1 Tax=Streptomyces sp. NPDC018947 TaxID=3365054 RepID=UPI00379FCCCE
MSGLRARRPAARRSERGRAARRAPTPDTGMGPVDACLRVRPPGEPDGRKGPPGTFTPSYAYDVAR